MKKTVTFTGRSKTGFKDSENKALRRDAWVPAVVYAGGQPATALSLSMVEVLDFLRSGEPAFITLQLEGQENRCILQEAQYHPVSGMLLHVDLYKISEDRPIQMDIPLVFEGASPGVAQGGELVIKKRRLKVKAFPASMPDSLPVDISGLPLGGKVVVSAIRQGDFTVLAKPQEPVAVVRIPRALRSKTAKGGA